MKNLSNENVIHIEKDEIQYLQFRKLLEYKDIISHAYSLGIDVNFRTGRAKNSEKLSKEDFNRAIQDYKKLCGAINENYIDVVKVIQEHTDNIVCINNKINKNQPDISMTEYTGKDGMITNKTGLVLSTTNADCILLLLFDPITKTIANVHSGWKGTLQRISVKAVEKMINDYNCKPQNIICCMCPSIRKCHFEVGIEVKEMFEKEFQDLKISESKEIMEKQLDNEKWNIDTVQINKIMLKGIGLKEENIIDSGICSVCNCDLVHSYRIEKQEYGLATAIISLKN